MWRDVHTGNLTNAMAYRDVLTGELKNIEVGGRTTKEKFAGDGSRTTFVLSNAPLPDSDLVFVQGVTSGPANYSILGSNLVFTAAPASGASIVIHYQY